MIRWEYIKNNIDDIINKDWKIILKNYIFFDSSRRSWMSIDNDEKILPKKIHSNYVFYSVCFNHWSSILWWV